MGDDKNLFNKYIANNFKYNRSIMVGILISIVITITFITLIISSKSVIEKTIESTTNNIGDLQFTFFDVESKDIDKYKNEEYTTYISQNIGYGTTDTNSIDKYINLVGIDMNIIDKYPLTITLGRLPANDSEVLITKSIINNLKDDINVGDNITLNVNELSVNGNKINQFNYNGNKEYKKEHLFTKTYKVVGIVNINNEMFGGYYSLRLYCYNKF